MRHLANLESEITQRRAKLGEAMEKARGQQAHLFELRAALDLFEVDGRRSKDAVEAALGRLGRESAYPEVDRARTLITTTE